ncbi:MAG: hypothetical protein WCS65_09455 [Verrucomicrobiae bacterium]
MADSDLVKTYLHRIRTQFYPDDEKGFFQQRSILLNAITTPARWLDERGVRIPERRLCQILDEILKGIMHHGATGKIQYFCRYFLFAVQEHMRHQGDRYYEEGKSLRAITNTAMEVLTKKQRARLSDAQDATTSRLADLNRLVRETAVKKRKQAKAPAGKQLDLFS